MLVTAGILLSLTTWLHLDKFCERAYLATLRQSGSLAQLIARQTEAFAKDENFEARYDQIVFLSSALDPLSTEEHLYAATGSRIRLPAGD